MRQDWPTSSAGFHPSAFDQDRLERPKWRQGHPQIAGLVRRGLLECEVGAGDQGARRGRPVPARPNLTRTACLQPSFAAVPKVYGSRPILTYCRAIPDGNTIFEVIRMSGPKTTHKQLVRILSGETVDNPAADLARRLTELADAIEKPNVFQKGQLVRWKAGLKNRAAPAYNEPAVVREVLAVPVFDTCETARCAGSPYFGEPLTLVLAILDSDGDFVEFRYDGRRFEPVVM